VAGFAAFGVREFLGVSVLRGLAFRLGDVFWALAISVIAIKPQQSATAMANFREHKP
jgi:hypothetical protein